MFRIIIGVFLIVLGLSALTGFSLFGFLFALLIIYIGLKMISSNGHIFNIVRSSLNENDLNEVIIFSPIDKIIKAKKFKGGKVVMIFSGGQIDLREVEADEKNVNIEFVIIFGGGKLTVPKNWKVNIDGVAIVGGYDNNTLTSGEGPTLNIKGAVIFGGLEIVN